MESVVIVGLLGLGAVLGAGCLWAFERIQRPKRQRAETKWQLALAQVRHERRRIASGPMFARAGLHLARISERAARALYLVQTDQKEAAIDELQDLQRHCQELANFMKPTKRRDDPDAWRL